LSLIMKRGRGLELEEAKWWQSNGKAVLGGGGGGGFRFGFVSLPFTADGVTFMGMPSRERKGEFGWGGDSFLVREEESMRKYAEKKGGKKLRRGVGVPESSHKSLLPVTKWKGHAASIPSQ